MSSRVDPPRVAWIAGPEDRWARARATAWGVAWVDRPDPRALRRLGAEVVWARWPVDDLARVAAATTLAGVAAVVVTPLGPARPLPWWERRFHRYLLPSQGAARAWRAAGVALGRLVVVEPGADPASGPPRLHRATADDEPAAIVAAAAAGAAFWSAEARDGLPPDAVIGGDPEALAADPARLARLGERSRGWVARGRTLADERAALEAVWVEAAAMGRRPGLVGVLRGLARPASARLRW